MSRTTNQTPVLIGLGTLSNDGTGSTLRDGGQIINGNFTDLYTAVNAISDYILPTASTSVLGGVKIDGTTVTINNGIISANIGTTISPSNSIPLIENGTGSIGTSLLYARADHVHPAVVSTAVIPTGVIVMWSGLVASIPSGWKLCDGTNGTPDLRNRFVVGAGSTYTELATGGSADAIVVSHSHTMGAATFTGTAMSAHSHTVTDPGHSHTYNTKTGVQPQSGSSTNCWVGNVAADTGTSTTGVTVNSASAGTPSGTIGGSTDTTGSTGTGKNLPPYLALAYIMKA